MGGRGRHDLTRIAVALSRGSAGRHAGGPGVDIEFRQPGFRAEGAMDLAGGFGPSGELEGVFLLQAPEYCGRETQIAAPAPEAGGLTVDLTGDTDADDFGFTVRIGGF